MNRKDRRTAEKQARKAGKAIDKQTDVAVDPKQVMAASLQDEIQKAIQKVGASPQDVPVIVQALGLTAAGLACRLGFSTKEFTEAMQTYMTQVRTALELPDDSESADRGPGLVLP